jgi:hypothetical protein
MLMYFNLFSWIHRNDSKEKILNFALKTYRNYFPNSDITFLRLKKIYPAIPPETLEEYLNESKIANRHGVELIENAGSLMTGMERNKLGRNKKFKQEFDVEMRQIFPWVNNSNLSSIFNWTCYGLFFEN